MDKQREVTVNQLRKYTKQRGLRVTQQGRLRQPSNGSVQERLEKMFGSAAPSTQMLQRIYSMRKSETRVPTPTEMYQLATVLNVPQIALTIDVDQPYDASPINNQNGNSLYNLDNISVFLNEYSMFLNPNNKHFQELIDMMPPELSTMRNACMLYAYKLRVGGSLRNLNPDSKHEVLRRNNIVINTGTLMTASDDLMRTEGLHYPANEREEANKLIQRAVTLLDIDQYELPYLDTYYMHLDERRANDNKH